ncbi:MAG: SUMF1/EgtB/PvdO family nonheme iron enzyme [Gammaproteobacteria bacterium]|nr:SUMF1/EgtB/PvdO family nonheme iron enzyme [Gammaproteobacteria bacterium]
MNGQTLLAQLSNLHQMLNQLLESLPETDAYRCYHARLAPLAWYFGRTMYLETYWLREVVQADADMTGRVREIFSPGHAPTEVQWRQLPPKDHLLNWALELQDENLMRLANPALLGEHPLTNNQRLHRIILQEHARNYEKMLMVLTQRRLDGAPSHRVERPLLPLPMKSEMVEVARGHYRVGANQDPAAYDNEEPAQIVELSAFRIQMTPVSNAAWLTFMLADGYLSRDLWSDPGWLWRQQQEAAHPDHWRQDRSGNWYAIGLNGPVELIAEEPVSGINRYEAEAFANWLRRQSDTFSGAVVQHEYQWEVAARLREIRGYGLAWEWCANRFQPYKDYRPSEYSEGRTFEFDDRHFSLRGACLHTQRALKRPSFRNRARADERHLFAGVRLVFPPE